MVLEINFVLCWKSAMKPHWRWWVRKLPSSKEKKTFFFVAYAHWEPESHTVHTAPYILHHTCLVVLNCGGWGISPGSNCSAGDKVAYDEMEQFRKWQQKHQGNRGSSKGTPEPARKTLVAWPWEKVKRGRACVVAQKKLASAKSESTAYCFDSRCAQSNRTGRCVQSF